MTSDEQRPIHRMARADAIGLRDVVVAVLRKHPGGITLADIYAAVDDDRPGTSTDAIRGELNHGVSDGRYVRLAPGRYGLAAAATR